MEHIAIEKKIFIWILSIILMGLVSHTIYLKYFSIKKEGFSLAKIGKAISKIFKFFGMIGDFFCWLGDAVRWMGATIAALMYYVGNVFTGCILFYFFDCIVGTAWFIIFLFASTFGQSKNFLKISKKLSVWKNGFDAMVYRNTNVHVFKYSDRTTKKCYKMKFEPFPKWPF